MRIFDLLPSDVPVEGVFPLPAPGRGGPRTSFQLVTRHSYQARDLGAFGALRTHKAALGGRHRLIWRPEAFRALAQTQEISTSVEVGGYLVGQVYRHADAPETLRVEVQQVLAADPWDEVTLITASGTYLRGGYDHRLVVRAVRTS